MIKRKLTAEVKSEKEKKPRTKKIKVNMASLPDAIVDGKFVVPVDGKIFFERKLDGRNPNIHQGFVKQVLENGSIEVWDDTRGQLFCFNVAQVTFQIKIG